MRYAIVSDIHANLAAWKQVLTDIADLKADKIICLGDVVGYGPDPVGVLESVHRVVHACLLGNHDAAVCGKLDPAVFSPRARDAVLRHRALLSERGLAWLADRPLVLSGPGFRCAHGDFAEPAAFRYIIEPAEALPSWQATSEQLLFVGHSHLPGIYVVGASGHPHFVHPFDFQAEPGKRYIVNPGSVGYPRVGDCRSSYCLFDDDARTVTFRSLPFDCEGYRAALRAAGLEDDPWLVAGESAHHLPSLRQRLSFAKPLAAAQHARDARRQASLAPRQTRRHLLLLLAGGGCAALAAGLAAYRAGHSAGRAPLAVQVPPYDLPALNAFPLLPPDKNLLPPLPDTIPADGRLEGWRYACDDRAGLTLATGLRDGALTLRATHAEPRTLHLESPLINLAGTRLDALRLRGVVRRLDGFSGTVFFQLATHVSKPGDLRAPGATHSFEVRDTRRAPAGGAALNRKLPLSKSVTYVRFRVEARFAGTLELEQPVLTDGAPPPAAPPPTPEAAP